MFQSDVDFSLLLGDNEKEGKEVSFMDTSSNESDALIGRFIRRLTMVVVHHVPLFWNLALSVFTGKFLAVSVLLLFREAAFLYQLLYIVLVLVNTIFNLRNI